MGLLRKLYGPDLDDIYKKIITGKDFNSNDFVSKWFKRIFNQITDILEKKYKADKLTQSDEVIPAFNLKNWLRQKVAFEDFKDNFKRLIKGDCERGG